LRDVLPALLSWWRSGGPAGLATVTATWSSAPRPAGAAMAVGPDGSVAGSVSGGCVEAAVYDLCRSVASSGQPRTARFGISDDDASGVGLTCGGTIELLIEQVCPTSFPELPELASAVLNGHPATLLTRLDNARHLLLTDGAHHGTLGDDQLDATALRSLSQAGADALKPRGAAGRSVTPAPSALDPAAADAHPATPGDDRPHPARTGTRPGDDRLGSAGALRLELGDGAVEVFAASFRPAPRMIVFGATEHAVATARIGGFLGYHVTVCDARAVFATPRRFPSADAVVVDWPHRYLAGEVAAGRIDDRTVLCVLTHDPKFDVPLLEAALRLDVAYVGAMGSRRTHRDRRRRLSDAGLADSELDLLSSPLGLDLGARSPEETAVSIAAEIIALRNGGTGRRLSTTSGPIHG
jgi:xanthine dehydrogenase accessory factor